MLYPLVTAVFAIQSGPELTSGRPIPPEQSCYDVEEYDLRVRVDPEARAIEGRVYVSARMLAPSAWVVLDLDERLTVDAVFVGASDGADSRGEALQPAHFERPAGEIRVPSAPLFRPGDSSFRVRVDYRGKPREAPNPPWDGGFVWSKTPSGAPWIATCNQMQGGDLWWPCKDQPNDEARRAFIRVTLPDGLVVATNGVQFEVARNYDVIQGQSRRGWSTYHWRVSTPINTYGIALNIAPYKTITRQYESVSGDSFPITYWVLPENLQKGIGLMSDIVQQMKQFEQLFGPYPFRADKYGVAETPHLGMEHQTIIAYGNNYKLDRWGEDRGYDELHLHEFAHEWWANLVTAENWNDFWIHESFASYAQALYAEHVGGQEKYFSEMREQKRFANQAAIAPRAKKSTAEMYFGDRPDSPGGDIYYKGSWVLHTLRWLLTDEEFFPALRLMAYPDPALEKTKDGQACRFATTDEIQWIAEQSSGVKLDWFFEVYLRQPKLPVLDTRLEGGELVLSWTSPTGAPFPMPVEVELGGQLLRVECPLGTGRLALGGRQDYRVDPRERVLRAGLVPEEKK
jgi:aminopeptidase N